MKISKIILILSCMYVVATETMFRCNPLLFKRAFHGYAVQCIPLSSFNRAEMNKTILQELLQADKSVQIAMYSFARKRLAYALAYLQNEKGVKVQIVLDAHSEKMKQKLKKYGILAQIYKKSKSLMHHKLAVIDDRIVIVGSYNYSNSAACHHRESASILYDSHHQKPVVNVYKQEIMHLLTKTKSKRIKFLSKLSTKKWNELLKKRSMKEYNETCRLWQKNGWIK